MTQPTRKGFGTTLLNSAIAGADAEPKIEYDSKGVHYTLEAPLLAITTSPRGRAG